MTIDRARELDAADPLAHYRDRFALPADTIYLDGNSLGCLPKDTPARIAEVVADEQFTARHSFIDVDHPVAGPLRQVAATLAGQVEASTLAVTDQSRTATDELLTAAGVAPATVAAWRRECVIA